MTQKLLILLMFVAFTNFLGAQDLKGFIKDKTNSAVKKTSKEANKEANKEADKGIDKGIDKLKGKLKGDKNSGTDSLQTETTGSENNQESESEVKSEDNNSNRSSNNAMNSIPGFNTGEPAKYSESYSFTGFFSMKMENWNDEGKSQGPIDYTTYFSGDDKVYAFEFYDPEKKNEKSMYIMDYVNNSMIIAGTDPENKSGMVMAIPPTSDTAVTETDAGTPTDNTGYDQLKKTGKTKTILGYLCEEYEQNNGEQISNLWITKDLNLNGNKLYGGMAGLNTLSGYGYGSGFMMEMTAVSTKTKEKTYYIVTAVEQSKKTDISLKDYQLMNMGSMTMPQE